MKKRPDWRRRNTEADGFNLAYFLMGKGMTDIDHTFLVHFLSTISFYFLLPFAFLLLQKQILLLHPKVHFDRLPVEDLRC